MSKKSVYVSPSVESVDVDSDIIACAASGGSLKPVDPTEPDQPDPDMDELY